MRRVGVCPLNLYPVGVPLKRAHGCAQEGARVSERVEARDGGGPVLGFVAGKLCTEVEP